MKKFLSFILALLYFATSNGATIHMHYCMGELIEKDLWHNDQQQCSKCRMDKSQGKDNGCCNDEHKQVKHEKEHLITEAAFKAVHFTTLALPVSFIEHPAVPFSSITEENPTSNAPPRSTGISLYIRNRVFRI